MRVHGIFSYVIFNLFCTDIIIGLWWAVGSPLVGIDRNSICKKNRRLVGRQQVICRKEPEIVTQVANGVTLAFSECQFQFKDRRWNCTTKHKTFRRVLKSDTREVAFINAITAAGVVYKITQACSMGKLSRQCECDKKLRDSVKDEAWKWGGCGDNVQFGNRKSKEFMDARPRKRAQDVKALTRLHNNEAGRLSVTKHMKLDCQCHGLTGSCNIKTCWRKMPLFREVGNRLKEKFDGAVKVVSSNDGRSLIPEGSSIKRPLREDLVYSERSPNFCKPNKRFGTSGTRGRQCNPDSMGVGGCEIMCCGRGYKRHSVNSTINCKCRLIYCCEVICQTCEITRTFYTCH